MPPYDAQRMAQGLAEQLARFLFPVVVTLEHLLDKSELAFQRPRLWREPERMKVLAMATLAYAFLLQRLSPRYEPLRLWLLRSFCHRTGWHLRLSSRSPSIACALPSAACGNAIPLALLPWAGPLACRLHGDHHLELISD